MIKHKYSEHIEALESIRKDFTIPQPILDKVDELQLLITEELHRIVSLRRDEAVIDSTDGTHE